MTTRAKATYLMSLSKRAMIIDGILDSALLQAMTGYAIAAFSPLSENTTVLVSGQKTRSAPVVRSKCTLQRL